MKTLLARLREDAGLRAISTNVTWLVADRLLGLMLSVVISVMVVRYLGPSEFGLLSYGLAVVALLAPLVQLGLDSVVTRDLATEPDAHEEILGTAAVLMLIAGALLIPLALVTASVVGPGDARLRSLVAILALQYVFHAGNVIDYWYRSELQSRYMVWSSKAGLLVNALLSVWFISAKAGTLTFAFAALLETAVTTSGLLLFYRLRGRFIGRWRFTAARARRLLTSSAPFLVGSFASAVYARVDFLILGSLMTERDVGVYAAAVRYTELGYTLPTALMISLFPALVRARHTMTAEQYARRVQALFDLMAAAAYVIVLPTTFLALPLMVTIFGPGYADAGRVLSVHIWTLLLVSVGMGRSSWLITEGLGMHYMMAAIGGAFVNIALDLALIPSLGVVGPAWASIAAQLFIILISSLLSRRLWPCASQVLRALVVLLRPGGLRRAFADVFHQRL